MIFDARVFSVLCTVKLSDKGWVKSKFPVMLKMTLVKDYYLQNGQFDFVPSWRECLWNSHRCCTELPSVNTHQWTLLLHSLFCLAVKLVLICAVLVLLLLQYFWVGFHCHMKWGGEFLAYYILNSISVPGTMGGHCSTSEVEGKNILAAFSRLHCRVFSWSPALNLNSVHCKCHKSAVVRMHSCCSLIPASN